MIKPLKSFGCSFVYGTDLPDCSSKNKSPSQLTYPALLAKRLGLEYLCRARGGTGNLYIMDTVIRAAANRTHEEQNLWIINWTFIDRFDYDYPSIGDVRTLRPGEVDTRSKFYFKNLHHEYADKLRSLICIYTAIQTLVAEKIPFMMTYMDDLLFDTEFHRSDATTFLQQQVQPYMTTFEGKNFLDWSKHKGYPISETWHPLEQAHAAAADFLMPIIDTIRHKA